MTSDVWSRYQEGTGEGIIDLTLSAHRVGAPVAHVIILSPDQGIVCYRGKRCSTSPDTDRNRFTQRPQIDGSKLLSLWDDKMSWRWTLQIRYEGLCPNMYLIIDCSFFPFHIRDVPNNILSYDHASRCGSEQSINFGQSAQANLDRSSRWGLRSCHGWLMLHCNFPQCSIYLTAICTPL